MALASRATAAQPYVVPPSQQFDGNDGSWSTFTVSVGSPGQQFRVLPSTKGGVTFVIAPDGCIKGVDPSNCQEERGIDVFGASQNIGFQTNVSSTWSYIGQYDISLETALNVTAKADYGFDSVSLGPTADASTSLSLSKQVVGSIGEQSYYLGMLPLGQAESSFSTLSEPIQPLIWNLRNASKIPSLSYAYTAGAKYQAKSVFGSLILGGYDSSRFKPNANDFSFTFAGDPSKLLTVGVESVSATNTLRGSFSLSASPHLSAIDSTVPHMWLPRDICDQFESAFGLTYDPRTDLYLVNDTVHSQLVANKPTITIKLVNSLGQTTSNYTNIQLPYAAFDLQASYPIYQNATNYFPIRRAANASQYVLGRTLLQEAYLTVDYERGNFKVAQAAFSDPMPSAQVVTITPPSTNSGSNGPSKLSTGAIVGIALGGAAVVLLVILALLHFRKRKLKKKKKYELPTNEMSESGSGHHLTSGPVPLKSSEPQELSGTPLTELASPHRENHGHPQDSKTIISMSDTPQELHAESRTPITPRWEEVRLPRPSHLREGDGESSTSRSVSQVPSDDGYTAGEGPRSAVSPLTGQFQYNSMLR